MNFLFSVSQGVLVCLLLWVVYFIPPLNYINKYLPQVVVKNIKKVLIGLCSVIMAFTIYTSSMTHGYKHELQATNNYYVPEHVELKRSDDNLIEEVDRFGKFDDKLKH